MVREGREKHFLLPRKLVEIGHHVFNNTRRRKRGKEEAKTRNYRENKYIQIFNISVSTFSSSIYGITFIIVWINTCSVIKTEDERVLLCCFIETAILFHQSYIN